MESALKTLWIIGTLISDGCLIINHKKCPDGKCIYDYQECEGKKIDLLVEFRVMMNRSSHRVKNKFRDADILYSVSRIYFTLI